MSRARLLGLVIAVALAAGCAELDPQVGALREDASVAGTDAGDGGDAGDGADAGHAGDAGDAARISFARDLRPLMNRLSTDATGHGCRACHYSTEPSHPALDDIGLDLATLGALRRGGATSGARIVVAGDPAASILVQKLEGTYAIGARMPRDGPAYWSADDIAKVKRWIAEGALGADDE